MKYKLNTVVAGEYITATMLNFLASAQAENHNSFVSAMFKNSGVITSCGKNHAYEHDLWVEAGTGGAAKITAGSFVDASGLVVNVPETQTNISLSIPTKIFIKHDTSHIVPNVKISGTKGTHMITFSSMAIFDYIEPGMQLMLFSDFKAGKTEGYEITTLGSNIVVKDELPKTFTDQEFVIVGRFFSGKAISRQALSPYLFHRYLISDSASTGTDFSQDWILLASVEYGDDGIQVRNIRYQSVEEIPDTEDSSIAKYAPNVASLSTVFTQKMEYDIVDFMTKGRLTIDLGEGDETKDIFADSHKQNTDIGTTHQSFDIKSSFGKFRLGDELDGDYVSRLYTTVTTKRDYLLPSILPLSKDTKVPLASLNVPQEFKTAQTIRPASAKPISNYTLTLDGSSNYYVVAGGGIVKTIKFSAASTITAEGAMTSLSSIPGQLVILKPTAKLSLATGGNIISGYLPTEKQVLADEEAYSEGKGQVFSVQANEPVALLNIDGTWLVVSAAMSVWRKFSVVQSEIKALDIRLSADIKTLKTYTETNIGLINDAAKLLTGRVTKLEEKMSTAETAIATNKASITSLDLTLKALLKQESSDVTSLVSRVTTLETTSTDHESRILAAESTLETHGGDISVIKTSISTLHTNVGTLQSDVAVLKGRTSALEVKVQPIPDQLSRINAQISEIWTAINNLKKGAIPKRVVVAVHFADSELSTYFDDVGRGLQGSIYEGFHICNGRDGAPNMQGRSLIMANSYKGSSSNFPLGTQGGKSWPSTAPGVNQDGIITPTLELGGEQARMLGKFGMTMTWSQMPKHRHFAQAQKSDNANQRGPFMRNEGVDALTRDRSVVDDSARASGYSGNSEPFWTLSPSYVTLFVIKLS